MLNSWCGDQNICKITIYKFLAQAQLKTLPSYNLRMRAVTNQPRSNSIKGWLHTMLSLISLLE